jgi:hypothetical protein
MSSFLGYTRKEITKDEYGSLWAGDLLVVGSVCDPSGCISPMSTPGIYRMVTIWGKAPEAPLMEANTEGKETKYFGYTPVDTSYNEPDCAICNDTCTLYDNDQNPIDCHCVDVYDDCQTVCP